MKAKRLDGLDLKRQQRLVEIVRKNWQISVPEFAKFLELNPKTVSDYFTRTRITTKSLVRFFFVLTDEIFVPSTPKEKAAWTAFLNSAGKKSLERKKEELQVLLKSRGIAYAIGDKKEEKEEQPPETDIGIFTGQPKELNTEEELALQNKFLLGLALDTSNTLVTVSDPDLRWLIFKDPKFRDELLKLLENLEKTVANLKSQIKSQTGEIAAPDRDDNEVTIGQFLSKLTMTLALTDSRTFQSLNKNELGMVEERVMVICMRLLAIYQEVRDLRKKKEE